MSKNHVVAISFLLLAGWVVAAQRPNMLVILTDDLGFSDIGCYGSEIETPTLDRLAESGLRFTQFYNTAKCHSSRVSLLSGRWCSQAGNNSLHRAVTIPEVLSPAGYFTAMSGKWHLAKEPTDFGFQRFFGHLSGACNYYKGDHTFRLNGAPWAVPDQGFYTTVTKVDFALSFLEEARAEQKPWFLYLAFNAPHAPLQPLRQDYEKYLGRYDQGWDRMRAARVAKQRRLHLFDQDLDPSPRPAHIPAWEDLIPEIRNWEARRMAAYAGLIDRVDQELGRLVADLEKAGELDNTIILFFSDNGACPYDRRHIGMDRQPYEPDVIWSDSTGWAWARNSPFRYYKQNQYEGGISTPAIIHWPAGIKHDPGRTIHTPAHLVDVLPTLAELAGAPIPETYPGRAPTPLAGVSLAPILAGKPLPKRPPIHLLFSSDRGLRDGAWKIVRFRSQPWELYNMAEDRAELHNVAAQHPERLAQMTGEWRRMARDVLMVPEKSRKPAEARATGHVHPEWSNYTGQHGASTRSRRPVAGTPRKPSSRPVRARRDTTLSIQQGAWHLTCEDGDPGLAFDRLGPIPEPGPYVLRFQVASQAGGEAELYYTTDASTTLPNGEHLLFRVPHDGQWHELHIPLRTSKPIHALRLDPCSRAGRVRIKDLSLLSATGKAYPLL